MPGGGETSNPNHDSRPWRLAAADNRSPAARRSGKCAPPRMYVASSLSEDANMSQHQRCTALRKSIVALLLFTAACGDRLTAPGARSTPANDAARAISDGANGGNKDV